MTDNKNDSKLIDAAQTDAQKSQKDTQEAAPVKKSLKERTIAYLKGMPKRYLITAFSGMTLGLFCTLIAGTIIQTLAEIFKSWAFPVYKFLYVIGFAAKVMMGAGIGAGIAYTLKAPKMVIMAAVAAGFFGGFAVNLFEVASSAPVDNLGTYIFRGAGNPINAYLCALVATEIGILVAGKTKLDILVVPLTCLIAAGLIAVLLGKPVDLLIKQIGKGIDAASRSQLFLMSIIISVSMGLLLTLPTSSAAIGISIGLTGLPAGAAVVGCCCHMIGFAVASFRENRVSGLISQGLGTSMLQIPNLSKNPRILLPQIISSAICGPLAVCLFGLQSDPVGSGMGTAGLVGIIETIKESSKLMPTWQMILGIALCMFILPAAISLLVSELMRKIKWIKYGDQKI